MNRYLMVLSALALLSCGDDDPKDKSCKLDDPRSCTGGKVCEPVEGSAKAACFAPVVVEGRVFELGEDLGLEGAHVVAEASTGHPVGELVLSGTDGAYTLRIPSVRRGKEGLPVGQTIKLRAAARDHAPFPSGVRMALPIDTSKAIREDGAWVVRGAATDLGLELLPEELLGLPSISGRAERGSPDAILVAAEPVVRTGATVTGHADSKGNYTLFNVQPGSYSVQAYQKGSNFDGATVEVVDTDLAGVDIARSDRAAGTVTGDVSIVAGNGVTTVVMALESTFDEEMSRGVLVPGLRAPEPGIAPNVAGAFSIPGVPDGNYVVLAAFENDGLVRDPDPDIAGTQIQRLRVENGVASIQPSFKVTSAIRMIGPGAGGFDEEIPGAPTFEWQAYPSAKNYLLELYDTFGNPVWETTVTGTRVPYDGSEELTPGIPYQWRLTAFGNAGNPISLSEDLLGVFHLAE